MIFCSKCSLELKWEGTPFPAKEEDSCDVCGRTDSLTLLYKRTLDLPPTPGLVDYSKQMRLEVREEHELERFAQIAIDQ